MRKPNESKHQANAVAGGHAPIHHQIQQEQLIQGYNNLVSTLKLVRKHRPFAENDNLPKICQPEDHIEVSSPRSSSSDEEEGDVEDDEDHE